MKQLLIIILFITVSSFGYSQTNNTIAYRLWKTSKGQVFQVGDSSKPGNLDSIKVYSFRYRFKVGLPGQFWIKSFTKPSVKALERFIAARFPTEKNVVIDMIVEDKERKPETVIDPQ